MIRYCYVSALALMLVLLLPAQQVVAQCIPGSPCEVPLTPNDPQDPTDGPNYTGPNASKSERDSCSADFMNQIHARAYIEANREIMIAGGVITRPDSILEYTCFDDRAQEVASPGGTIFTGSARWISTTVPNPGAGPIQLQVFMGFAKLQQPIQDLVLQSLNSYTGTFPSTFLGGIPGGPAKGCGVMSTVYSFAKCEDVNDAIHIMSFAEISGTDPRNLATSAGTCSDNPITTSMISVANNDGGAHAHKDDALSHLDFVAQPSSAGVTCADPISTGLIVRQEQYSVAADGTVTPGTVTEFEERICSTPGCYYTGGTGGTCQR